MQPWGGVELLVLSCLDQARQCLREGTSMLKGRHVNAIKARGSIGIQPLNMLGHQNAQSQMSKASGSGNH
eukprot:scaffold327514_cov104-Tisochrysis_lutea.AAC.1